jgi:hypothetical protein
MMRVMASIRANKDLAVEWFKRTLGSYTIDICFIRDSP